MNLSKKTASKRDAAAHDCENETFSIYTTNEWAKTAAQVTPCDINQEVRSQESKQLTLSFYF